MRSALFRAETYQRRRGAIGGLAFGIALPLLLAGLVMAVMSGGLSDTPVPPPPVYVIE